MSPEFERVTPNKKIIFQMCPSDPDKNDTSKRSRPSLRRTIFSRALIMIEKVTGKFIAPLFEEWRLQGFLVILCHSLIPLWVFLSHTIHFWRTGFPEVRTWGDTEIFYIFNYTIPSPAVRGTV